MSLFVWGQFIAQAGPLYNANTKLISCQEYADYNPSIALSVGLENVYIDETTIIKTIKINIKR